MLVDKANPESGFPELAEFCKEITKVWEKYYPEGLKDLFNIAQKIGESNKRTPVLTQIGDHMANAVLDAQLIGSSEDLGHLLDMYAQCKDPDFRKRFITSKQVQLGMQEKIREALDQTKDQAIDSKCRIWHNLHRDFDDIRQGLNVFQQYGLVWSNHTCVVIHESILV